MPNIHARRLLTVALAFTSSACSVDEGTARERSRDRTDAFAACSRLGTGVNLGNALEAPKEGEWGLTIRDEYFRFIRKAGFDSVRIPIRWSAHAETVAPYDIDDAFFKRIDRLIDLALKEKLAVVVNVHHYEELYADPSAHRERFLVLWKQMAERYHDRSDLLCFELLNEPFDKLDADRWNALLEDALSIVRQSNPQRFVIVGPVHWNNISHLEKLKIPEDDDRLIVTVHYYEPYRFTHQGAPWADGSRDWLGMKWSGTPKEKRTVRTDLDAAADWAKSHNRPIYLGEFGSYEKADLESRARWTTFVRHEARSRGFSCAYWEFGSGFGVFDPNRNEWKKPLLNALLPGAR